jgi:hypothetical protein
VFAFVCVCVRARVRACVCVCAIMRGNTVMWMASYQAALFIDASYEGDLMAAAGVSYVTGREGVADFNESLAGCVAFGV